MLNRLKILLNSGGKRTALAKKNIFGSFGLKIIDILADFALVPISLNYLSNSEYGLWLTIFSLIAWFRFFDVGISHGLRNKLSESLGEMNYSLAKSYISTAYVLILCASLLLTLLSLIIIPLIGWETVFNVNSGSTLLIYLLYIVFISFAFQLTLKIISSIFLANQVPIWSNLIMTLTKIFTVVGILIISLMGESSLLLYASIYSLSPLIIMVVLSVWAFKYKYPYLKPSIKSYDKLRIKDIMGLGVKFFIIQIGVAVLFSSDNIIITHIMGPADVTPYQIAHKYFNISLVVFTVIIAPFWSAITEAFAKGDFDWIKKTMKQLEKTWIICSLFTLILLTAFYPVLEFWVGDDINVPFLLALQWALFVILQMLNLIYTFFLNGIGKIHLQLITGVFTIFLNVPLSIFFAKYMNLGSSGVLLATNLSVVLYVVTRRIQYYKIINGRAHGVWNK